MNTKKLVYKNCLLFQLFIVLFVSYNYVFPSNEVSSAIIYAAILLEVIFFLYMLKEIERLHQIELNSNNIRLQLENAQDYITSIRSKHHDFVNHLQVIMGLSQMGKKEELIAYIKELAVGLIEIEKLIELKRPEVAAIISSKITSLSYLRVTLNVSTDLDKLEISPCDMISILGNLLDNALSEISSKDDKYLEIGLGEEDNYYVFKISNPGMIPAEINEHIFEPGITTKGSGNGLGLYNVKNLIEKYHGSITFDLTVEGKVTSVIKLPQS